MGADELELAARKSRQYLALRPDNAAQVDDLFFDHQNFVEYFLGRILQRLLLQLGDLQRELIQRGFVVLDDGIQQNVRDAIRRARDVHRSFDGALFGLRHAPQRVIVIGHQEVFAEEEVQFAGGEYAILAAVIDRMYHDK